MANAEDFNGAAEAPSKSDVQVQLERILASGDLCLPDRARSFLRYVVEETLAERSEYLKAYTIAHTIFRRSNFDAQNDPAVRIEAGRIRRELERFYLLSRQPEPVLITIPKGGYVPSFRANPEHDRTSAAQPARNEARSEGAPKLSVGFIAAVVGLSFLGITTMSLLFRPDLSTETVHNLINEMPPPTVVVEPFDDAGGSGQTAEVSRVLRDEIIVKLVAAGRRTVIATPTGLSTSADERYVLQGSVRGSDELIRLTTRLVRQADGAVLWSDGYNLNQRSDTSIGPEEAVATQVARGISGPLKIASLSPRPTMPPTEQRMRPEHGGGRESGVMSGEPQSLARNMGHAAIPDRPF
ncbi:hypothetical protein [Rhizobium mesoamericanum]|uniref:Uncharacterized protein n=1 Tax=Rhizobium mesoamericanum STM3625 TaxID=1211777 RepID=K0PV57_9HYPH|nr:hypothetical protein [Rhizobium mesoamericanum]CCM75345.1 hypothetical protein BN77_2489 [Rhizobium mesoamericanum STM3625]